jgi:hypothetical protein
MTTTLTTDDRVDDLQASLYACVKALDRVESIERELAEIKETLNQAAEVAYNITIYDAGTRDSREARRLLVRQR